MALINVFIGMTVISLAVCSGATVAGHYNRDWRLKRLAHEALGCTIGFAATTLIGLLFI